MLNWKQDNVMNYSKILHSVISELICSVAPEMHTQKVCKYIFPSGYFVCSLMPSINGIMFIYQYVACLPFVQNGY